MVEACFAWTNWRDDGTGKSVPQERATESRDGCGMVESGLSFVSSLLDK